MTDLFQSVGLLLSLYLFWFAVTWLRHLTCWTRLGLSKTCVTWCAVSPRLVLTTAWEGSCQLICESLFTNVSILACMWLNFTFAFVIVSDNNNKPSSISYVCTRRPTWPISCPCFWNAIKLTMLAHSRNFRILFGWGNPSICSKTVWNSRSIGEYQCILDTKISIFMQKVFCLSMKNGL